MKVGKITSKKATSTVAMVGGATAGAMLSDAIVSVIPLDNPTYKRLAVLGLSAAALMAVNTGNSTGGAALNGVLTGMALQQAVKTSREALTKALPASATQSSFVQAALDTQRAALEMPHLGMPVRFNPDSFSLGNPSAQPQEERLSINAASLVG